MCLWFWVVEKCPSFIRLEKPCRLSIATAIAPAYRRSSYRGTGKVSPALLVALRAYLWSERVTLHFGDASRSPDRNTREKVVVEGVVGEVRGLRATAAAERPPKTAFVNLPRVPHAPFSGNGTKSLVQQCQRFGCDDGPRIFVMGSCCDQFHSIRCMHGDDSRSTSRRRLLLTVVGASI